MVGWSAFFGAGKPTIENVENEGQGVSTKRQWRGHQREVAILDVCFYWSEPCGLVCL